ncbi:MAG: rhodanese-like domain-containing protein [Desulfobulbaceae bacterium]|nr:rhodanese-like domain-containing protein [Candidatus Kapabacteria bacterium]MBS3999579.1 rhodanese-like domain-containing protein [Desulfobulbaceae bacterium]
MLNRFSKFFAILLAIVFIASCSDDETTTPTINEGDLLIKYLEANGDYVNTYLPALITASDLHTLNQTGKAYIIDLRADTDFATGHIKNAVNVKLADLLTHIKTVDMTKYDKVALVCYTGQTAGFATSLMRFLGYDKVFDLKFGMCSWHNDFAGKWKGAISNSYASQFVNTPSPAKPAKGKLPELKTGKTTGKEILEARVDALLKEGFGAAGINAQATFQDLSKYYIANYWTEAQYLDPGHIPGAIQYTPKESLKYSVDLTTLPTDKPIIIYCHTGTQSSMLAAFLRLMGYDAKSLLFGANSMIYDKMVEKKLSIWKDAEIIGLEYEK